MTLNPDEKIQWNNLIDTALVNTFLGALEQQTEPNTTLEDPKVKTGIETKVQGPPEAGHHQDSESKSRAIETW